jgi:hypothetical protein
VTIAAPYSPANHTCYVDTACHLASPLQARGKSLPIASSTLTAGGEQHAKITPARPVRSSRLRLLCAIPPCGQRTNHPWKLLERHT